MWEFPANWQVKNNPAAGPTNAQILLEVLPDGMQSGESIAMIQIDPGHFTENAPPTFNEKVWLPLLKQNNGTDLGDLTLGNGLPVQRYDYKSAQEPVHYLTFLTGPRKGYGIDFVILANSISDSEEMIHTLIGMKIRPDWPANAAPIAGHFQPSEQAPEGARILDKSTNSSRLKRKIAPEYPLQARAAGVHGVVKLLAHIGTDGNIKDLYLLSGPPILCDPAIAAVSQWKYQPYLFQGKPVEVETSIDITFEMGN